MPVMDGYETMRGDPRARPVRGTLPIIAVTGKVVDRRARSAASTPAPTTTSRSRSTRRSCWRACASGSRATPPTARWRRASTARSTAADRAPRSSSSTTTPASASRSSSVLEPLGHAIVEADSGEAALRAVMRADLRGDPDGRPDAEHGRLRDGRADPQRAAVRAHADHLHHRARDATRPRSATATRAAPSTSSSRRSSRTSCARRSRSSSTCSSSRASWSVARRVTALNAAFRDSEVRTRVGARERRGRHRHGQRATGVIESFNRAAAELFGYDEDEVIGQSFAMMVGAEVPATTPATRDAERQPWSPQLERRPLGRVGRPPQGRLDVPDGARPERRGARRPARSTSAACATSPSARPTPRRSQHQALHDDLTGLPNRVLFGDRVDQAISGAVRTRRVAGACWSWTSTASSRSTTRSATSTATSCSSSVAERLVGCLRDRRHGRAARRRRVRRSCRASGTDLAGGGDRRLEDPAGARAAVRGRRPRVDVEASIGIALVPEHGDNIDDLLRRADLAMYDAKRAGTGYALFAAEQEDDARAPPGAARRPAPTASSATSSSCTTSRRSTSRRARRSASRRCCAGTTPRARCCMPDEFMPEVERSELMIPITEWVLDEALRQLRDVARRGLRPDDGGQPRRPLPRRAAARCSTRSTQLTGRWGIPPDRLTLELTESALIDTAVPGMLERLHDDGRAALDRRLRHRLLVARLPPAAARSSRSRSTARSS